jgi:NDP-sugar pyrophosphorylase family protein
MYLLEQLSRAGVRHVVLCTGYQGEQVYNAIGERQGDIQLEYSRESEPLGTAGALRLALPFFRSDPVLVMNGDSYCRSDLNEFVEWHRKQNAAASLLLTEVPDAGRFGRVQVSDDGTIRKFEEKTGTGVGGWINAGVYLMGTRFLSEIPRTGFASLERDMFPRWTEKGLRGYRGRGCFIDIGTAASYHEAGVFFPSPLANFPGEEPKT